MQITSSKGNRLFLCLGSSCSWSVTGQGQLPEEKGELPSRSHDRTGRSQAGLLLQGGAVLLRAPPAQPLAPS